MLPFLLGHIQTQPEHDLTRSPPDVDQIVEMTSYLYLKHGSQLATTQRPEPSLN